MNTQQSRVIGALILLLGISCLIAAIYTKQFDSLIELLKQTFP